MVLKETRSNEQSYVGVKVPHIWLPAGKMSPFATMKTVHCHRENSS